MILGNESASNRVNFVSGMASQDAKPFQAKRRYVDSRKITKQMFEVSYAVWGVVIKRRCLTNIKCRVNICE